MIFENNSNQVYLAIGPTDLRKSIDGLAVLVQEGFNLDPFTTALFVFCNRKKDKVKILQWQHNGFWLYYRRLEKGRFIWPEGKKDLAPISRRELNWLLDGLPLNQQLAHREVKARIII